MATGFELAQKVERKARAMLAPLIHERSKNGYVETDKGRLSRHFQKKYGDVIANRNAGEMVTLEIKAEEEDRHKNFFLEEWSNKSRETRGWMHHLDCDVLWYFFIKERELYEMKFDVLKAWFMEHGDKYPLKPQKKYNQLNDTWGRCVPIDKLALAITIHKTVINPARMFHTTILRPTQRPITNSTVTKPEPCLFGTT